MTESQVATYVVAAAYEHLFSGLARYWRKKGAAALVRDGQLLLWPADADACSVFGSTSRRSA